MARPVAQLSIHTGVRYVVPLREGGSMPAVIETEDNNLFVTKFRGAGQGARVLVAELIVGGIAEILDLPVPDLCLIMLDESFGRSERDPEIQDILAGSRGINVGMLFLEGALNFNPLVDHRLLTAQMASDVVWLDAFTTNIDRTVRNPNMLVWGRDVWLIDHGSALFFHHDWESVEPSRAYSPFAPIRDHVLLPYASDLEGADARAKNRITEKALRKILDSIPDELLLDLPEGRAQSFESADAYRDAYLDYLIRRLSRSEVFVDEARHAREQLHREPKRTLSYRR